MTPTLKGIDHVHIYVRDRSAAETWYEDVLGLRPVDALLQWASDGGPLTLEDEAGTVHLALFERAEPAASTAVAFGASGAAFIDWKQHLEAKGIELRVTDHTLAWSLYFHDPEQNLYEITTYDHAEVAERLRSSAA